MIILKPSDVIVKETDLPSSMVILFFYFTTALFACFAAEEKKEFVIGTSQNLLLQQCAHTAFDVLYFETVNKIQ